MRSSMALFKKNLQLFSLFMIFTFNSLNSSELTKEDLCQTPTLVSAKVSPDGKKIACVGADEKGIANLFIYDSLDNLEQKKWLSHFKESNIIQFYWGPNSDEVLLLVDQEGKAQHQIVGYKLEGDEKTYTSHLKAHCAKVYTTSKESNTVYVGLNDRSPSFHDVYALNLDQGALKLIYQNDEYAKILVSPKGEIVLKVKIDSEGAWTAYTKNDEVFLTLTSAEAFNTELLSYDESSNSLLFLDNRFTNTNLLTQKSLEAPFKETIWGGFEESDVDEVLFLDSKPVALASYTTEKSWQPLEDTVAADIAFLNEKLSRNFEVVNTSKTHWMIYHSVPDQGVQFWLYDRSNKTLKELSAPSTKKFAKMYPFKMKAQDGLELIGYYTLPIDKDRGGYVDEPIAFIAVPHGGPFKVRDRYEFDPFHQWLASLGYGVMNVNFRLSSGLGKKHVNAGNGQWGKKANQDVIDAMKHCIEKGLADPSKLGIFGASYGGFEALAGITFTPDFFNCSVAICGPSNLKTVLDGVPQFWEFTAKSLSDQTLFFTKKAFITSMGGDPGTEEGQKYLNECSPLSHLDQIKKPLLLIHGENDHIVLERESRQIYESMKKAGKEVTYLNFKSEGHRIAQYPNKYAYLDAAEKFLHKHLGGRCNNSNPSVLEKATAEFFE